MKVVSMATVLGAVLLTGCATPGNLQSDLAQIDTALAGKRHDGRIAIEFIVPPNEVVGSTEMFVGGAYIKGGKRLDTESIAKETVKTVFGKLFSEVEIVESLPHSAHDLYTLKVQALSEISEWDGTHVADIAAEFYDADRTQMLEAKVRHVVDHIQYAQEEPMRRAYLRAFTDLALQIHDRLTGSSQSSEARGTELMSTARPKK